MKISMKGDYGIRALVDLAEHYGEGLVQSNDIAARQGIPEPFLDQLLTTLRKAGLIRSMRGPQGGHSLARPPDEITLTQVILALEGTVSPIACLDDPNGCSCGQREVWEEVRAATLKVTDAITVGELQRRAAQRQVRAMYYI